MTGVGGWGALEQLTGRDKYKRNKLANLHFKGDNKRRGAKDFTSKKAASLRAVRFGDQTFTVSKTLALKVKGLIFRLGSFLLVVVYFPCYKAVSKI